MFLKCQLFYPLMETYFPLQLYTEIFEMRLIVVYLSYNNMSPERFKSKRESMRNVERLVEVLVCKHDCSRELKQNRC